VLHRLAELDAEVRKGYSAYDFQGVFQKLFQFCTVDLSAVYFDIRKDSLYCDAKDAPRRRAARTVLDHLHRCLCAWLAPVLVFTAEEAWLSRFGEDAESIHQQDFPQLPAEWHDAALAERWVEIRRTRKLVTASLEDHRRDGLFGSSLQARLGLSLPGASLRAAEWADILIVSQVTLGEGAEVALDVALAPGAKCERCWRVLPEVGASATHPGLCLRCEAVVEA
jgi:isoleucyl-tRNA synthetase